MSYLDELKDLVMLHAVGQEMDPAACRQVLDRISREDGEGAGGWAHEWMAAGDRGMAAARPLEAMYAYNLARFPFIDSPQRKEAHDRCIEAFAMWSQAGRTKIVVEDVTCGGLHFPIYHAPHPRADRPLLLVIGGIVSIKEQWYRFLTTGRALGVSVAVAECPGVGENPLPYTPDSHHMLGSIIDHLSRGYPSRQVYVVGMSFGGHLAMQRAIRDDRIRGITTVGAPVHHFFQDEAWWNGVPETTRKTLAHVCQTPPEALFDHLRGFSIPAEQLASLRIPLNYIRSRHDEIIPAEETPFLQSHLPSLRLTEFDDVHGSPHHMPEMRKLIPLTILEGLGGRHLQRIALSAALRLSLRKREMASPGVPRRRILLDPLSAAGLPT